MGAMSVKKFKAMLEPLDDGLGWVVMWLPFDVAKAWPKMVRLRVVVEVGGEVFRTSIFSARHAVVPEHRKPERLKGKAAPARVLENVRLGRHFLLVNKKMQAAAGVGVGGIVEFKMDADLAEREAILPPELVKILKQDKALKKWYEGLSYAIRKDVGRWIEEVKSGEARVRRAEQIAERLMLTMEGELVLPPVLELAFKRKPAARVGWEKMTVAQRRGNLMAIFYYQSPEAREKRVGKVVEDCLKVAGKGK